MSPSPPQLPLHHQAFYSHFHLDQTARQLWERREPSKVQVEDILQTHSRHQPNNPAELVGGVMVFCDFEDTFYIPLTDGKWKIAVGVQPHQGSSGHLSVSEGLGRIQTGQIGACLYLV